MLGILYFYMRYVSPYGILIKKNKKGNEQTKENEATKKTLNKRAFLSPLLWRGWGRLPKNNTIMAQEDDLRALGKVMDFMRGISVIFLLVNCYWFCYEAFQQWHFTLGIINKILMNFQRTTGLFSSILWTKLFCVVFLALSCLGTKGVKEEKITWPKIWIALFRRFCVLFPQLVALGIAHR